MPGGTAGAEAAGVGVVAGEGATGEGVAPPPAPPRGVGRRQSRLKATTPTTAAATSRPHTAADILFRAGFGCGFITRRGGGSTRTSRVRAVSTAGGPSAGPVVCGLGGGGLAGASAAGGCGLFGGAGAGCRRARAAPSPTSMVPFRIRRQPPLTLETTAGSLTQTSPAEGWAQS